MLCPRIGCWLPVGAEGLKNAGSSLNFGESKSRESDVVRNFFSGRNKKKVCHKFHLMHDKTFFRRIRLFRKRKKSAENFRYSFNGTHYLASNLKITGSNLGLGNIGKLRLHCTSSPVHKPSAATASRLFRVQRHFTSENTT